MDSILKSPREYKRQREMFLDEQFHQRYPEGMFTLQRRRSTRWPPAIGEEIDNFAIYWHPHRRHGTCYQNNCQSGKHLKTKMIAALYQTFESSYHSKGLRYETYQNNAFGKCTYYTSLEATLAGARRLNFPEELIQGFLEKYREISGE